MTETLPEPQATEPPIDPKLIQELFDRDPLKLADADYDTIIRWYRDERVQYLQAPAEKAAKKAAGPKGPKQTEIGDDLLSGLI